MHDLAVSRLLYVARLLERAVHETTGWTVQWGPHTVSATRVLTEDGVRFEAAFPEACYLTPMPPNASLLHNGEVVAIRALEHPGDTAFVLEWALHIEGAGALL